MGVKLDFKVEVMKKYGTRFSIVFFREIFVMHCLSVSVDESLFEKYGSRTEWKMQVLVFASPAADSLHALPLPGWSHRRRKKEGGNYQDRPRNWEEIGLVGSKTLAPLFLKKVWEWGGWQQKHHTIVYIKWN